MARVVIMMEMFSLTHEIHFEMLKYGRTHEASFCWEVELVKKNSYE